MKIGVNKPSLALTASGFKCRIISVKLLVFRVNVLLDTNTKIFMITKLRII